MSDAETPPRDAPLALRAELAASIDRTLAEEARRNELAIAAVRVGALSAAAAVELWLLSGPSALGSWALPLAGSTFAWLAGAVAIWAWLRRGGWSRALAVALPLADATWMTARIGAIPVVAGLAHATRVQELATVVGMASLLAVSGAFRLQPRAVWWTTALGVAMYAGFAAWFGLAPFHAVVHLVLVVSVGAMAASLTRIVRRAVHHEVTHLTLRRLLPASVVDAADTDPMALLTEPRALDATVVVTDLRGFTAWSEHRPPLEVLAMLNRIQGALAAIVIAHGGTVDKFMGDGMLAVFGAPTALPDHADRALAAVREMVARTRSFGDLRLGIGVHSGEVVVGCLGAGIRMEFTVLGDTVNTASRLEAATKEHPAPVLISDATRARATLRLDPIGEIPLRGRRALTAWTLPDL